jgi:hypothetical protein
VARNLKLPVFHRWWRWRRNKPVVVVAHVGNWGRLKRRWRLRRRYRIKPFIFRKILRRWWGWLERRLWIDLFR